MKLGNKIVIAAAAAVLVTTIGSVITVYFVSKTNRINSLRDVMATTLRQAEKVREQFETIHGDQGIDMAGLVERAKAKNEGQPLAKVYTKTPLYNTIPIVAAWQSVQEIADQKHFKFYTPTCPGVPPRNPKNAPSEEFTELFAAFAKGTNEYFHIDKSKNELIFARPVILTKSCLTCHGDPQRSQTHDGKDYLGLQMENMKEGNLKGAFILVSPMSDDPVMQATMQKILGVGFITLLFVTAAFYYLNRRMIINPLLSSIEKINESGEQTGQAASEISKASTALAEAASEQAASIEETSSSLEEMASMTKRNAEGAQKVKDLATQARQAADSGSGQMVEMNQAMHEIQTASSGINKIIKTIDEIAFQTNILALNAAVEAARAGEAGLGFAVVAEEVRNLAQRSASAAKETAAKIEDSINKSQRGVVISAKVSQHLEEIANKVRQVDELVAEIATASHEQSQGIEQVNIAVTQMDKVTQSNAAMSEETASSSQQLNSQATLLKQEVAELLEMIEGKGHVGEHASAQKKTPAPTKTPSEMPVKRAPSVTRVFSEEPEKKQAPARLTSPRKPAASKNEFPLDDDFKDF